jgi:hypothetical protein
MQKNRPATLGNSHFLRSSKFADVPMYVNILEEERHDFLAALSGP